MLSYTLMQNIISKVPIGLKFDNPSKWEYSREYNGFRVHLNYYYADNSSVGINYFINFADLILINGVDVRNKQ